MCIRDSCLILDKTDLERHFTIFWETLWFLTRYTLLCLSNQRDLNVNKDECEPSNIVKEGNLNDYTDEIIDLKEKLNDVENNIDKSHEYNYEFD